MAVITSHSGSLSDRLAGEGPAVRGIARFLGSALLRLRALKAYYYAYSKRAPSAKEVSIRSQAH